MQKLNTLKPGDKFVWDGKKYVFHERITHIGIGSAHCYESKHITNSIFLSLGELVKPIIRINSN